MQFVFTAKMLITYFQRVSGYLQYIFFYFSITIFQSAAGKQPLAEGGYAVEIEQKRLIIIMHMDWYVARSWHI